MIAKFDGGHGGKDSGAIGFGLYEKNVALELATAAAKRLEAKYDSVSCELSRNTDVFIELADRPKGQHDVFVSFHCNAYDGKARGFESFAQPGRSTKLRDAIHAEVSPLLKRYNIPDRGTKTKDLAVLRGASCDATLIECLFIDNKQDNELLKNASFKAALVESIVDGVAKFLGLQPKTNGDDDKLELSKTQHTMLVTAVNDFIKQGVISDKAWAEKAEKGTLTVSELTWLNTIATQRLLQKK